MHIELTNKLTTEKFIEQFIDKYKKLRLEEFGF